MAEKYDCLVVGSGPGGYAAAIRCAQRGASVVVVEKDFIGGTCLNYGCIPSKTLLASAQTLLLAKRAARMGVDIPSATPNFSRMQDRKNAIVTALRKGLTRLIESNRIRIVKGRAILTAPDRAEVKTDAGPIEIQARRIILATGSEPIQLAELGFDKQTVLSSKEILELRQIPKSLLIVGGGVIGCEFACLFAALGTRVTIAEARQRLIPTEDRWVGRLAEREFKKQGITTLTNQTVASIDRSTGLARVTLESGAKIEAEKVLLAVGRTAVCDKETIQSLDLKMDSSAIAVNEKLETSVAGVYAVGDVVGTTFLAHGAFAEAKVAAINATGGNEKIADYSLIPRAVYTFPEVASVGITEQDCKDQGRNVRVGRALFKANGRSAALEETVGEIRVVRDVSTNRIISVTMVGAIVTELLGTARALIGSTGKIADVSFPHPSASEVLKEAVEDAFGCSLHNLPGT